MDVELHRRLAELEDGRARCRRRAASLARWSTFWTSVLITSGAVVVAHAAFDRFLMRASWMTVPVLVLGIVTAVGAGILSFLRPAERAAAFADDAQVRRRAARATE